MNSQFTYKELYNIISESDNNILTEGLDKIWVRNIDKIKSKELFLKKNYTLKSAERYISDVGVEFAHMCYNANYIVSDSELDTDSSDTLFKLRKKLEQYPLKENHGIYKPGRWHTMLNISLTHPYGILYPHTDDPKTLVENNPNHIPAHIKGLIYLGDSSKEYVGFGTRLYENNLRGSEFKEIPFIPTNGFLFVPNENSYHGTFYSSTEIKKRYSIVFEYVLLENL